MTDPAPSPSLFQSFFQAGFECSSHKRRDGVRLDVLAATGHDVRAAEDYALMARHGMRTVRDGVRWHLIETAPGVYDFSSFLPMLRAARESGTQVIWDLFHYGWPDGLDIWSPAWVDRFAAFARAVAQVVRDETDAVPFYTPVNEISFVAWGGGDVEYLNPFVRGRGGELKRILVRAAIAATRAVREVEPRARFVAAEPLIHIFPKSRGSADVEQARLHTLGQFEAMDMLAGLQQTELGGAPDVLDLVGLNFYFNNQWIDRGPTVALGDGLYRPLHEMLAEVEARYRRPLFIAETGTETTGRAPWLHYVCDEVAEARRIGVPVEGVCLYPVLSHLGWDDARHCHNGLFSGLDPAGPRTAHPPFAAELARQQRLLADPAARYAEGKR